MKRSGREGNGEGRGVMNDIPAIGGKRMAIRPRKMSLEHIMMFCDVLRSKGERGREWKKEARLLDVIFGVQ